MDKTQIEKNIESIRKTGQKLDKLIQDTGLATIEHVEAHGDVRLVNRLYLALPKGARKAAFTEWLLAHAKVQANAGENKKEAPFVYAKEKTTNIAGAVQKPWFDFKPDPAPDQVFDVMKALTALLNKAGKANEVTDPALLAKLQAVVAE